MQGTIAYYNYAKAYGFIRRSEGQKDVFFHVSEYQGPRDPDMGQRVTFEIRATDRGSVAYQVVPVDLNRTRQA